MNLKIKAVLFDLVGTLIYVRDSVGTVYHNIARTFGFNINPDKLDNSFKIAIHSVPLPGGGEEEEKNWWRKVVYETFVRTCPGKPPPQDLFERMFEIVFKEFTKKTTWAIHPDVVPSLEKLKDMKIMLGLISNFDSRLEIILKELELFEYFDCLSYSGKIGFSKPDPRIFQYALKELNIIPEEAIYIGDSLDSDYYPALNLNINAILIYRNRDYKQQVSTDIKTISNLNQIFDFLSCHCKGRDD